MTNAELFAWLQWHQQHAPYLWGGLLGSVVLAKGVRHVHRRGSPRQDAQWATWREIRQVRLNGTQGFVVGAYKGYTLRYAGEGHVVVIARTRTGKTSTETVPTLLEEQPGTSFLVNDAKGELYRMTHRYRETVSRVYRLDATSSGTDHLNPFDMVRLGAPEEASDLRVLSRLLAQSDARPATDTSEAFWEDITADVEQALILMGLLTGQALHPAAFYELLGTRTVPDLIVELDAVGHHHCTSIATQLKEMTENQQKSAILNIRRHFAIYSDELLARMTSRSDFRPEDLRTGAQPCTVYLTVPFDDDDLINVNKLLLRQLLGRTARANPTPSTTRKTMHGWDYNLDVLVDEGQILKRVELFPVLLDYSAGFGIRIIYITPSLNRLEALYGKNNFLESTAVQVYFGIVDGEVAKLVSTRLGMHTIRRVRVTKGRGGMSRSYDEVREPLMDVSEVLHLADDQLIVFANKAQLLATQLPWYAYSPWAERGESLQ